MCLLVLVCGYICCLFVWLVISLEMIFVDLEMCLHAHACCFFMELVFIILWLSFKSSRPQHLTVNENSSYAIEECVLSPLLFYSSHPAQGFPQFVCLNMYHPISVRSSTWMFSNVCKHLLLSDSFCHGQRRNDLEPMYAPSLKTSLCDCVTFHLLSATWCDRNRLIENINLYSDPVFTWY